MYQIQHSRKQWIHVLVILLCIGLAYFKLVLAQYCPWDDDDYVINNKDIQGITWNHIQSWFTHFYVGNYCPLSIGSYALDTALGGLNAMSYHLTNLLLHSFNAVLLYFLILTVQPKRNVALFTALLFALNPVQVEAVAWISERKTLLCAFFYLLSLWQYAIYLKKPKAFRLALIYVFAIAAMLSKAIAVSLPLAMVAIDMWLLREINVKKHLAVKVPLMVISVIIGLVAIKAEAAGKFLGLHPEFSGLNSLLLSAQTYMHYIFHVVWPVHLSLYYLFPDHLSSVHYLYLFIALIIGFLFIIAVYKKEYVFSGGILFFTVNIALVLQFVQFSYFLSADHYSYIASIGIIFPVVYYLFYGVGLLNRPIAGLVICLCVSILLLVACAKETNIWTSDLNFVTALTDGYPNSSVAQSTEGAVLMKYGKYAEAETHLTRAVLLDPRNYKAWYNKGAVALQQGNAVEALNAFNRCLGIYPYSLAYFDRAVLNMSTGKIGPALDDANQTLSAQPGNARAWYIKGYCLAGSGNIEGAIGCYDKAISFEGTEPLFYQMRGKAYTDQHQYSLAIMDLNTAIAMDTRNAVSYYYRGIAKYESGGAPCSDFQTALQKGYRVPPEVLQKVCDGK